ncbi:copper resistance CopC family protein [Plantibacter sp. Mn2098]|uniref:copper resistance CopC family protein n=1 Tax=Plantibacter sp. Mn2098 TaxID=3395266 RepID=UPI003BE3D47B
MTVTQRFRTAVVAMAAALIAVPVVAGIVVGGVAAPASAHNTILSTTPEKDSTVTEQPGQIVITTNDNLLDLGEAGNANQIQVSGPGTEKLYYGTACAAVNGPALVMPVQFGQPGVYTVTWQLVSTDGHPLSGSYTFTWAPAVGQELATGVSTPPCAKAGAVVEPAPAASDEPSSSASASSAPSGDVWWIVGAIAIVVLAGIALLFVTRRKA